MDSPTTITIPPLLEGSDAIITWDSVGGAEEYDLVRKFDTDGDFILVYDGPNTSFTEEIPLGTSTAIYGVRATGGADERTWAERDAADLDWTTIDANATPWYGEISAWLYSPETAVDPIEPPIINGFPDDFGLVYKGFSFSFSITENNPSDAVNVSASLDDDVIASFSSVQLGVPYTVSISDEQIFSMVDESAHTIKIAAEGNLTTVKIATFTAMKDVSATAVYYVLRDSMPVAQLRGEKSWADYLSSGSHSYAIRAVDKYDNYVDSNTVIVDTDLVFSVLASVENPSEIVEMSRSLEGVPQNGRSISRVSNGLRFEGDALPIMSSSKEWSDAREFGFSHFSLAEMQRLLLMKDEIVVVRNQYGERTFGQIASYSPAYIYRANNQRDAVIDYSVQIEAKEYEERIQYL